ncbi:hypothetical protein P7C70_g939, partial [Phenoliferia sp. Uapishka_3]
MLMERTSVVAAPPPYSPSPPTQLLPPLHHDSGSPRMNRLALEMINPYSGVGDSSYHPESSTFSMMRERENRAIERERIRILHLQESAPPPSYPGPSTTATTASAITIPAPRVEAPHDHHDYSAPPPAVTWRGAHDDYRPTPADREQARLQRLHARSASPPATRMAPIYYDLPTPTPAAPEPRISRVRSPERFTVVDPPEFHTRVLERSTIALGPIRNITPQQRESERLERLRLRDATRRLVRSVFEEQGTPHEAVDPYVLAEAIETSLRERQRALDRLHSISPQQRERERLERIRTREAARAAASMSASAQRMRQASSRESLVGNASMRRASGRVSAV